MRLIDAPRNPGAISSQGTRVAFNVEAHDKKCGPVTYQRVKKYVSWLGYYSLESRRNSKVTVSNKIKCKKQNQILFQ